MDLVKYASAYGWAAIVWCVAPAALAQSQAPRAQTAPPTVPPAATVPSPITAPSAAQLDALTAPIALYPDALVSQVLMATTYPDDVVAAAQWSAAHASVSGDAAVKSVADLNWDPSVQSLVAFPSVLDMMGRQPQWVVAIGNAFLDAPDKVMDSVQRLRGQARAVGTLTSNAQQKVTTANDGGKTVVVIQPADPQVVYVPSYNPNVVYGAWPYPNMPPAYYPPPPESAFFTAVAAGIGFGIGVAAVDSLWGGCDWGRGDVNINVNRYNNINANRRIDVSGARAQWQHNPANRGSTPYTTAGANRRYEAARQAGVASRPMSQQGFARAASTPSNSDREAARQRASQTVQQRTGVNIGHGSTATANRPRAAGRTAGDGSISGARHASHSPSFTGSPRASAAGSHHGADIDRARSASRAMNRPSAFQGAGDGDAMRRQAQRIGLPVQGVREPGGRLPGGGGMPHVRGRG
ncbi:DUF3300 domain-containing protein [Achromobacter sp. KS-M25]|nr:DUF3300 domain-containing protein [Achromobacter aestuarii]